MPIRRASSSTASAVASEVAMPRITSTRAMTGTGFMKCMPMNRSGRPVAAARRVMEIEEVFDARMAAGAQIRSSLPKSSFLMSSFSTIASTTASAFPRASRSVVVVSRPRAAALSSARALALGHLAIEILLDRGPGLLEQRLRDVDENHRATRGGGDMGDAPAHLSPADHTQGADFHGQTLSRRDRASIRHAVASAVNESPGLSLPSRRAPLKTRPLKKPGGTSAFRSGRREPRRRRRSRRRSRRERPRRAEARRRRARRSRRRARRDGARAPRS